MCSYDTLLIEQHADQQCERIVGEQGVRFGRAGKVHAAILPVGASPG